jgi:hypothetical protein
MPKPSIRSDIRQARIERILAAKPSALLTAPWMRRTLSLVTVLSSYVILASLLIPTPYWISKTGRIYRDSQFEENYPLIDIRDRAYTVALVLVIWSFMLLRQSLRKNTLLPDQYLSDLQVTNRNWAFKTGYAWVKRIGLGIALLFGFFATSAKSLAGFSAGYGPTPKAIRAFERYVSDLSMEDPFGFYFKLFSLLAFLAYSLPIILLAWREARFAEPIAVPQEAIELSPQASTAKLYFDSLKWIVLFFAVFATLWISPLVFMGVQGLVYLFLMLFVFVAIPGALFLFIWAAITVTKGVRAIRKAGYVSAEQQRFTNLTTLFLTINLLLGLTVGINMAAAFLGFYGSAGLGIALVVGLLMIPTQALSMTFFAKLENKADPAGPKLW